VRTEVSPDCGAATVIHDVRRLHDTRPRVSIIVVSHRRHAEICECLSDLAAQRTTVPFEVVLLLQAYPSGAPESLAARFSGASGSGYAPYQVICRPAGSSAQSWSVSSEATWS